MVFSYGGPRLGNLVNNVAADQSGLTCPVHDPFTRTDLDATVPRDVFVLSLRGFNFGPARLDGKGPLVLSGQGTSRAFSSVVVTTKLISSVGAEIEYNVTCFEEWSHEVIRFVVPYQGSVSVVTTSVGVTGEVVVQRSETMTFRYDQPSLRSNDKDLTRPAVPANGTGVVRIIGRFLFERNSTVTTRVTIGGAAAGMPILEGNVVFGDYAPSEATRALQTSTAPNQYLDITVPAWQGSRVPLVVFKILQSGTTTGSDPFYIDIEAPVVTSVQGSRGTSTNFLAAVTARTNGSRVVISGSNIGAFGTRIVFLSSALSRVQGTFTDCVRGAGFVDCLAPPGVGRTDDTGSPLRIALVQPGLHCDPEQQSSGAIAWNTCSVVVNEADFVQAPLTGWLMRYEPPVVVSITPSLPSDGGIMVVSGYNFGRNVTDITARLDPRVGSTEQPIEMTHEGTEISLDPATQLQTLRLVVGPGLGVNWTLSLQVKDQVMEPATPAEAQVLRFSFDPPVVANMSRVTGSTAGGYNVTLTGRNFGTPQFFAAVGEYVCAPACAPCRLPGAGRERERERDWLLFCGCAVFHLLETKVCVFVACAPCVVQGPHRRRRGRGRYFCSGCSGAHCAAVFHHVSDACVPGPQACVRGFGWSGLQQGGVHVLAAIHRQHDAGYAADVGLGRRGSQWGLLWIVPRGVDVVLPSGHRNVSPVRGDGGCY